MVEVECPRCGQYWYANEVQRGRARLCERCAGHLRHKRAKRGLIDIPFLIAAVMLLLLDLIWIALSALEPSLFPKIMLAYGGLLCFGGLTALSWLGFSRDEGFAAYFSSFTYDTNWQLGRWALLSAISGLICVFAAGMFLGFK